MKVKIQSVEHTLPYYYANKISPKSYEVGFIDAKSKTSITNTKTALGVQCQIELQYGKPQDFSHWFKPEFAVDQDDFFAAFTVAVGALRSIDDRLDCAYTKSGETRVAM